MSIVKFMKLRQMIQDIMLKMILNQHLKNLMEPVLPC